jgi:prepilin-type N-terminal cleavage/methylation domain-containing protein
MVAKHQFNQCDGFTLIEMSIVLVIIGLIVGGVLAGQSLISAAAVRAQINQIASYNAAVNTFRDKYGGIPGDLPINLANQFGFLVPASCTGSLGQRDGNGLIQSNHSSSGDSLAALMGENILFWADLSSANLGGFTYATGSNLTLDANCTNSVTITDVSTALPAGKIGYGTFLHVYSHNSYNWYMLAQIGAFSASTSVVTASPTIPVSQAYNIDTKMDDGLPTTGNVVAVYVNNSQNSITSAPNAATDSTTTCYDNSGPAYSISISGGSLPNCGLSFRFQ